MKNYKCLSEQVFSKNSYTLVPIRNEDKFNIMRWRNEQIIHLRQNELLTEQIQEKYFKDVIEGLFAQKKPKQLLFSFLYKNECIGYGGLVHIDWDSKNAEISFITKTIRTLDNHIFKADFSIFLELIFEISYKQLDFIKLHTTFYDIDERKNYRDIIKNYSFVREAKLTKHKIIFDKLYDVFIYSHFRTNNE